MRTRRLFGSLSPFLFWRLFSLRHARKEWLQTILQLLILGLGVGTFISIRMANRAAVEGFQLFTDSLNGTSDWIIEEPGNGIAVDELITIRQQLGNIPVQIFPVLEHSADRLPVEGANATTPASPVRLLGLDLIQIQSVASKTTLQDEADFWEILDDPDHLLISQSVAEEWGLEPADSIDLVLQGQLYSFNIGGILPEFRDGIPLPKNLAIADIASLQRRLGATSVNRVELLIPPGPLRERHVEQAGDRIKSAFGNQWVISSAQSKSVDGASMTTAFRLNLSVLSLIALLVGTYLIAQTLDATVSLRRREIATLRSLGVSSGDIQRLWLSEALIYGLMAGVAGLLIGQAMATLTVDAVTVTVRSLYRDTVQTAAGIHFGDILLSFGLGLGGSFIAAWIPAKDAASTPPAQFLRIGKRIPPFPIFQNKWAGSGILLLGAMLLFLPPWKPSPGVTIPAAGYLTAFLWLTGGTIVSAMALKWIGTGIHSLAGDSPTIRLAGSRLMQPTSRHQLALSGFFVAIGMAAAMTFLISSFEHTVTGWLQQRLRADLFISSIGFQGSDSDQRISGESLDAIELLPGIEAVDRFRSLEVRIAEVPTTLAGSRFDLLGKQQELLWIRPPDTESNSPAGADTIGYANENLVRRTGLSIGDLVSIQTPQGIKSIRIGGIQADYSRDNGLLQIDLAVLEEWYQVSNYETASVFLESGISPAAYQSTLRSRFPGLAIRQNGELMETALFIFNQTFAVTRALQAIGLTVAMAGLALSLLSLLRESGRELALQRTLGMTRHEIATTTAIEGTGIALTGLLAGLALSVALGYVLIYVINRQSFGWTLQVSYPWKDVLTLGTSVLVLGFGIAYSTGWLYLRNWKQEPI